MDQPRTSSALERIEAAMARIEAAAARPRTDVGNGADEALRRTVAASIKDLDVLIARLEA